jgi:hypothetical protein
MPIIGIHTSLSLNVDQKQSLTDQIKALTDGKDYQSKIWIEFYQTDCRTLKYDYTAGNRDMERRNRITIGVKRDRAELLHEVAKTLAPLSLKDRPFKFHTYLIEGSYSPEEAAMLT